MVVLLDEIRNCQDVLNKIADMKLGHLGTALVTIINQVGCQQCSYSVLNILCVHLKTTTVLWPFSGTTR